MGQRSDKGPMGNDSKLALKYYCLAAALYTVGVATGRARASPHAHLSNVLIAERHTVMESNGKSTSSL